MGLYRQPNDYTCGPFALKHALVALGRLADEQAISHVAHPHWWAGTDEVKLARAARHFDCELPLIRRTDPDRAHSALVRHVSNATPVLLCVDDWGHWVTAVKHESERFVILDSRHEPVVQVLSWPQLRNRWRYFEEEEDTTFYDLHPVKPRYRVAAKAQFSVERAQFLRRPENAHLAKYWDDYLGDLMEICRPRSARASSALAMGQFLRRHEDQLVERIRYWHGEIPRASVLRIIRNFRFVADTYGLAITANSTRRALMDMCMLLGLWAAAAGGVGSMYGSDEPCHRSRHRRHGHRRYR